MITFLIESGIVNGVVQLGAIIAYVSFGIIWPTYIVMTFICLIVIVQSIAYATAFNKVKFSDDQYNYSRILLSVFYIVSCYHIYLLGFVFFSGFAASHITLGLLLGLNKSQ